MIEIVRKLLTSSNSEDILLAAEYMYNYCTIEEIKEVANYKDVPKTNIGIAFRIGDYECLCYAWDSIYISALRWEEEVYQKTNNVTYLGNHKDYKP